jgi:hypothetical protein
VAGAVGPSKNCDTADSAVLLRCGFGKAPQLPRMQSLPFLRFQPLQSAAAIMAWLKSEPLVSAIGLPWFSIVRAKASDASSPGTLRERHEAKHGNQPPIDG